MKKLSIAILVMAFGLACAVQAGDKEAGKDLTPEQQKERAALIKKYDTNKDGVLDKNEIKKMSKDDRKALAKLGGIGTAEEKGKDGKADPDKGDQGRGKK